MITSWLRVLLSTICPDLFDYLLGPTYRISLSYSLDLFHRSLDPTCFVTDTFRADFFFVLWPQLGTCAFWALTCFSRWMSTCLIVCWPPFVIFPFGPDLFYLFLAPSGFIVFWPRFVLFSFGSDLFYFHLAPTYFIFFWPRLVLFSFGPDLFYFHLAPTCFIFFWPRLVLFSFGPDLFYLFLASTCLIFIWPRLVLLSLGPNELFFSQK